MEKKRYVTTKEECLERVKGRVCDYCGRPLEAMETVDNSDNPTYWAGCNHGNANGWGHFTNGTTKEIFNMAKEYILRYGVISFNDDTNIKTYKEYQLNKAVEIITKVIHLKDKVRKENRRFANWREFNKINKPVS